MNHPTTIKECLQLLVSETSEYEVAPKDVAKYADLNAAIETALQDITRIVNKAKPYSGENHYINHDAVKVHDKAISTYNENLRKVLK